MDIVFFGTPEIAKVCLEEILKSKHHVSLVVTKPDKENGRGKQITFSPVKTLALKNNIPVMQLEKVGDGVEEIKKHKPDILVLVAFGQLLPKKVLDIALPINLHGSLLPKYRGPSPIQTAILNGDKTTGITIMIMDEKMDEGDILFQKQIDIDDVDTSEILFNKMANVGSKFLVECLDKIEARIMPIKKQNNAEATYCNVLTKDKARLDFSKTTQEIINKIRAYNPNPVAFFLINNTKIKVFSAKNTEILEIVEKNKKNGTILFADTKKGLVIKTQDGAIEILEIQAPNGKRMLAKTYLNGNKIEVGYVV